MTTWHNFTLVLLLIGIVNTASQESAQKLSTPGPLKETTQDLQNDEYDDNSEEDGEDVEYYDYDDEDEQEVENSVDMELEEPNFASNDTSRIFRLRQKRRRRRRPRRGRKPRRGRRRRPPPPRPARPFGFGGRLRGPKPFDIEEIEERPVKHGNLINYAEPIGPFYSETNHIPIPETPVLLAIYPKKRKSRSGPPERMLEFKREPSPTTTPTTTTSTTRKPDVVHHYHHASTKAPQSLQQTFNIAIPQAPAQPQPIVIQQPSPPKTPSLTKVSVSAFIQQPQSSVPWTTTPRPVYGAPLVAAPQNQYGVPNNSNRNCATWTPFFYNNLQQNRGSHYFGRRIDSVQERNNCQYQNQAQNSFNSNSWANSNSYGAPAPPATTYANYASPNYANTNNNQLNNNNNPNIVSTITRYYPTTHAQTPATTSTSTSTFQITPSQAYEISQNLYESFKQKLLQEQQQQQQLSINVAQPLPFADVNQNTIDNNFNNPSSNNNLNANADDSGFQTQNQNQGSSEFEQEPAISVPVSQTLKAPKESYNYLTYKNNQLSSEDYEFPTSEEQFQDFTLPLKKQKKKRKKKPSTIPTGKKTKKEKKQQFKAEKTKLLSEVITAVKNDFDAIPVRLFNNLFPKIFVSKTKNGGKDIEFTIGK